MFERSRLASDNTGSPARASTASFVPTLLAGVVERSVTSRLETSLDEAPGEITCVRLSPHPPNDPAEHSR